MEEEGKFSIAKSNFYETGLFGPLVKAKTLKRRKYSHNKYDSRVPLV